ncbi:hypothetical protein GCM10009836_45480 [Pseudonocardia ailaonensis]|uniref:Tyr recombinase domain-containing protein n=1 Tax=Pseudonocardia ailaonensis TaxID=367279 RepID=A0ABN2NAM9_9PSEU
MPKRYQALVYGVGLALRHGEALALELQHVDFLRREVRVEQQLTVLVQPATTSFQHQNAVPSRLRSVPHPT